MSKLSGANNCEGLLLFISFIRSFDILFLTILPQFSLFTFSILVVTLEDPTGWELKTLVVDSFKVIAFLML